MAQGLGQPCYELCASNGAAELGRKRRRRWSEQKREKEEGRRRVGSPGGSRVDKWARGSAGVGESTTAIGGEGWVDGGVPRLSGSTSRAETT
jgi:hypothetical protein